MLSIHRSLLQHGGFMLVNLFKSNLLASFLLVTFFGVILQFLAKELKFHINFGMQLFVTGYIVMALGFIGTFIALMTAKSKSL